MRLCEIPGPFIRSPFLVTKYDQGWNTMATTGGNVQMLNWQLRVQLPHLLKMMLKLETHCFICVFWTSNVFLFGCRLEESECVPQFDTGPIWRFKITQFLETIAVRCVWTKTPAVFVQMGSCSLWQKQGAPFAGGANGYVQDRQHAVG